MSAGVVRWREHECTSKHQTASAFLVCALYGCRRKEVTGKGRFAVLHKWRHLYGRGRVSNTWKVSLFENLAEAQELMDIMHQQHRNAGKCSGQCTGMPRLVEVVL